MAGMGFPDVFQRHQDGFVIGSLDRSQDSHHPVGMRVGLAFGNESVAGLEYIPHLESGEPGGFRSQHRFPGTVKPPSLNGPQPGLVFPWHHIGKDFLFRAAEPEPPETVPKGQGQHLVGFAALPQVFHFSIRDVPDGPVPQKYRIQHQLVGRSLGTCQDGKGSRRPVQALVQSPGQLDHEYRQGTGHRCQKDQQPVPEGPPPQG